MEKEVKSLRKQQNILLHLMKHHFDLYMGYTAKYLSIKWEIIRLERERKEEK
ncbi:hypothetical protein V9L05_08775 [Bernardetia sp. Wsw4-3y2]|uniref:hypothetical protein n=1 Tax=Bernardetia sp. Wsw4-3y2 TaxID=3127471 RepID=UPI0030CCB63F